MQFQIDYTGIAEQRLLKYILEDCSFDMEPTVNIVNYDIVINKINLTVDGDDRVVQIWGYCGKNEWIISDCLVPKCKKGRLIVHDDLKSGLSHRIRKDSFATYINAESGWICIGDPKKKGNAVEFINNCIFVLDDNNEFISLWLKPEIVPSNQNWKTVLIK